MFTVGLATVAMDVILQTRELPKEDGFAVIEKSAYLPGGSGTNVIAQLARLGDACGFVAEIGDDAVGTEIRRSLLDEGIDDSGLKVRKGGSSLHTKIVVDAAGKKFILLDMGDAFLNLELEEKDLEYCLKGDIFYTDLLPGKAAIAAAKAASGHGKQVVFNLQIGLSLMEGMGVSKEDILGVLKDVDVFAPCRKGLFALAGTEDLREALRFLRPYFSGLLLVTLGGEGSAAFDEADRETRVSVPKAEIADTTGAGDSYLGAFIHAYLIEKMPLREAMEFAACCAAITCGKVGARSGPDLAVAEEFLRRAEWKA